MPYTVHLIAYRKPGVSPSAFKKHYETSHIPLLQSLTGPLFPKSHTRKYTQRSEDGTATVIVGDQESFPYDALSELVFEDEEGFKKFFAKVGEEGSKEKILADEALFLDKERTKAVVIGESVVTEGKKVLPMEKKALPTEKKEKKEGKSGSKSLKQRWKELHEFQ